MAVLVKFTKSWKNFKKDDVQSVSESIRDKVVNLEKVAVDHKEPTTAKETKEK